MGIKTLTYSASFFEEEESSDKTENAAKKGGESVLMFFTVALSIILAVGLFILLPAWISEFIRKGIDNNMFDVVVADFSFFVELSDCEPGRFNPHPHIPPANAKSNRKN